MLQHMGRKPMQSLPTCYNLFISTGASKKAWNDLVDKTDTLVDYRAITKVTNAVVLRGLQDKKDWMHVRINGKSMGRMLDYAYMHKKTLEDMGTILAEAYEEHENTSLGEPLEGDVLEATDLPDGSLVASSSWHTDAWQNSNKVMAIPTPAKKKEMKGRGYNIHGHITRSSFMITSVSVADSGVLLKFYKPTLPQSPHYAQQLARVEQNDSAETLAAIIIPLDESRKKLEERPQEIEFPADSPLYGRPVHFRTRRVLDEKGLMAQNGLGTGCSGTFGTPDTFVARHHFGDGRRPVEWRTSVCRELLAALSNFAEHGTMRDMHAVLKKHAQCCGIGAGARRYGALKVVLQRTGQHVPEGSSFVGGCTVSERRALDILIAGQTSPPQSNAPAGPDGLHTSLRSLNHTRDEAVKGQEEAGVGMVLHDREFAIGIHATYKGMSGVPCLEWGSNVDLLTGDFMCPHFQKLVDMFMALQHSLKTCGSNAAARDAASELCVQFVQYCNIYCPDISIINYWQKCLVDFPAILASAQSIMDDYTGWGEHGNSKEKNAEARHSPKGGGRQDKCELNRNVMTRELMENTPYIWGERDKEELEKLQRARGQRPCKGCGAFGHYSTSMNCSVYKNALKHMDVAGLADYEAKRGRLRHNTARVEACQRINPPLVHLVCGLTRSEDVCVISPLLVPLWCMGIYDVHASGPMLQDVFETPFVSSVSCSMNGSTQVVAWAQCDEQASLKVKGDVVTLAFLGLGLRTKVMCGREGVSMECGEDYAHAAMEVILSLCGPKTQLREVIPDHPNEANEPSSTRAKYEAVPCLLGDDTCRLFVRVARLRGEQMVVWMRENGVTVQVDAAVGEACRRYVAVHDKKRKRVPASKEDGIEEDGSGGDANSGSVDASLELPTDIVGDTLCDVDESPLMEGGGQCDGDGSPTGSPPAGDGGDSPPPRRQQDEWECMGCTPPRFIIQVLPTESHLRERYRIFFMEARKRGSMEKLDRCKLRHVGFFLRESATKSYIFRQCGSQWNCKECTKDAGVSVVGIQQRDLSCRVGDPSWEMWWEFAPTYYMDRTGTVPTVRGVRLKERGGVWHALEAAVDAAMESQKQWLRSTRHDSGAFRFKNNLLKKVLIFPHD